MRHNVAMMAGGDLVAMLRERAANGAGLLELVNLVHDVECAPRYRKGLIMRWFQEAFGLHPLDYTGIIWACDVFGDGASLPLAEADQMFRTRLEEIANGRTFPGFMER